MTDALLIPFWLEFAESNGPIGLGVTAHNLDDAKRLIVKGATETSCMTSTRSTRPSTR